MPPLRSKFSTRVSKKFVSTINLDQAINGRLNDSQISNAILFLRKKKNIINSEKVNIIKEEEN